MGSRHARMISLTYCSPRPRHDALPTPSWHERTQESPRVTSRARRNEPRKRPYINSLAFRLACCTGEACPSATDPPLPVRSEQTFGSLRASAQTNWPGARTNPRQLRTRDGRPNPGTRATNPHKRIRPAHGRTRAACRRSSWFLLEDGPGHGSSAGSGTAGAWAGSAPAAAEPWHRRTRP
jgi:hypothetical protein